MREYLDNSTKESRRMEKINGHFMENKDEYLKELYLTFLFAVSDETGLTERRIELLYKLSNGLNLKYEQILKKAKTINGEFFTEILKNFKDKEETEYLLIDMLILLNIDSDFGEKHSKLTASIFEMFNVSQSGLQNIIEKTNYLLIIKLDRIKYNDYPIILRHKKLKTLENFINVDNKFWMNKFQVTQKEYTLIMGKNPSNVKGDNLPVEQVSLYDAIEYCNKKSIKEGFEPVYTIIGTQSISIDRTKNGYRLPTGEEWEYAAKGGSLSKGFKYSGSNNADEVAWYDATSGSKTHDVGTKKPNELGIYDMSGNVWEWTDSISGILCGGAWAWCGTYSDITVNSHRNYTPIYSMVNTVGFRVVQSLGLF